MSRLRRHGALSTGLRREIRICPHGAQHIDNHTSAKIAGKKQVLVLMTYVRLFDSERTEHDRATFRSLPEFELQASLISQLCTSQRASHSSPFSPVMLSLFVLLAGTVLALYLYGLFNDQRLSQLPSEVIAFAPNRFTPHVVREAAEKLSSSPKIVKDVLPAKTGRRYIVVGGVNSLIVSVVLFANAYAFIGWLLGRLDCPTTPATWRGPEKDQDPRYPASDSSRFSHWLSCARCFLTSRHI